MVTSTFNVRERLSGLLEDDLAFHNNASSYLLHSLHAFAAKFPPPLPRHFIQGLSLPGETVLDPMSGSGATLVEGWLLSRNTIGVDLDPLALRQGRVKTLCFEPQRVSGAGQRVIDDAMLLNSLGNALAQFLDDVDEPTKDFIDYWFKPDTQRELAALLLSIRREPSADLRELFEVLFSSTIVTKSGGVSMARDLAHSRPHRVDTKTPRNAIKMFESQLKQAIKSFREISDLAKGKSSIIQADCRNLPLGNESVDLIVTSPPYANAIDYMRAHKFSLVWLGASIKPLSILRSKYIGSEKLAGLEDTVLPREATGIIDTLAELDSSKAQILKKYLREMSLAIQEMYRVIRRGRAVVIVVGPSTMRGLSIETQDYLAAIAEETRFDVVGLVSRPLDRDKRMMPARWHNNGQSLIEQRMHQEYVVGIVKP